MGPKMRVLEGGWERRQSPLEAAYDHFRLELRGNLVSPATLEHYDYMARPFLRWLADEQPQVRSFEDLSVAAVRTYRPSWRAATTGQPATATPHPARLSPSPDDLFALGPR